MFFLRIFLFLLVSFKFVIVEARWATPDDMWVEYDLYNTEIKVNKEGLSEETTESKYKILKENDRKENNFYFEYDLNNEKLEVLEAYITENGDKQNMKKPSISEEISGKTQNIRRIDLTFPNSIIGSEIYIKFKITQFLPNIKNFYSTRFSFFDKYFKNFDVKIISDLPLNVEKNDPKKILKIVQSKTSKQKLNMVEISLLKPLIQQVVDYDLGGLDSKDLTYVDVSTETVWNKFAKLISKSYQDILSSEIPKAFEDILRFSQDVNNEVDKINIITSTISEKINYDALLENKREQFSPRSLEEIAESLSGNSRDFAAITGAILAKLNFKVQFAIIWKGFKRFSFESKNPLINDFNWVILKVTGKDGKIYWIDPANFFSMADGILPEISGKSVLVLDEQYPTYEITPNIDPLHSKITKTEEIEILDKKTDNVATKIKLSIKGEQAVDFTGLDLRLTDQEVKHRVFSFATGLPLNYFDKVKNLKITIPKLDSKIVKNLEIDLSYQIEGRFSNSSLGKSTKILLHNLITDIINCPDNKAHNLIIGPISTYERIFIIKNLKIQDLKNLDYSINNKWFSLKRSTEYQEKDSLIKLSLMVKKNVIDSDDLKSAEFQKLQRELNANFEDFSIILKD